MATRYWPSPEEIREMKIVPHSRLEAEARKHRAVCIHDLDVPTVMGRFQLGASAFGVALLLLPETDDYDLFDKMDYYGLAFASFGKQRAIEAGLELMGYLLGEVRHLETPVDWSYLSPFAQDVCRALRSVPYGEKITYNELAALAGHPGKGMAASGVLRSNPTPIFVPCHRVVPASGEVGGWCGDVAWKRWLLKHEGIVVRERPRA